MYHHWGRTSMYRPLSYLFRSMRKFTFSFEVTLQSCVWNDLGARWMSVGTVATTLQVESNISSEPTKWMNYNLS